MLRSEVEKVDLSRGQLEVCYLSASSTPHVGCLLSLPVTVVTVFVLLLALFSRIGNNETTGREDVRTGRLELRLSSMYKVCM